MDTSKKVSFYSSLGTFFHTDLLKADLRGIDLLILEELVVDPKGTPCCSKLNIYGILNVDFDLYEVLFLPRWHCPVDLRGTVC